MINESIKRITPNNLESSLQFILVTHKRSLFLNGKSLVGVAKSASNPFSKAYSLLLEEEGEN
jgi:chromosome segregation ATPase